MKFAPFLLVLFALPFSAQPKNSSNPISLDPGNPHYFLYGGKTIALITSGEHYGSVMNADFDYLQYLAIIAADGLNYTRIFGGSYVEVPGKSFGIQRNTLATAPGRLILPWARSTDSGYAGGGNRFDLDQWDPEFFRRLHDFLAEAQRLGIVVEISLFSSQYGDVQWRFSPFHAANNVNQTEVTDYKKLNTLDNGNVLARQERYVRKLVHEVNYFPNVIFEIQNEPWSDHPVLTDVVNPYLFPPQRDQYPNSIEVADEASIAWQTRVVEWIASEESALSHKHLIAQCYSNFRLPVRKLIDGVSMVNFHYAYPEAVMWNSGINKAIAYDETGFLGRGDAAYLRQAWNFMLSGGGAFDALDYSFTTDHPDGTDTAPNGPGGGSPAFRKQLGILAKFLSRLQLNGMNPDPRVVVRAEGVVARALSNSHGDCAIYLDGNGPSRLTLHLPPGSYKVAWLNTKTGKLTPGEAPLTVGNRGDLTVATPGFENGIALTLTSVYLHN
jgi:hypothetical protein